MDGKDGSQITSNDSPDLQPYWFPDGRRIAFLSTRNNGMGLWSVDLETRREEPIAQLAEAAARFEESANGTSSGNRVIALADASWR